MLKLKFTPNFSEAFVFIGFWTHLQLSILFHTFFLFLFSNLYIFHFLNFALHPLQTNSLGHMQIYHSLVHIVTYSCFSARGAGFTCQTENTKAYSSTNGQLLHNRTPYLTTQGKLAVLISAKNTYLKIKGGESALLVLSRTSESPFKPDLWVMTDVQKVSSFSSK